MDRGGVRKLLEKVIYLRKLEVLFIEVKMFLEGLIVLLLWQLVVCIGGTWFYCYD